MSNVNISQMEQEILGMEQRIKNMKEQLEKAKERKETDGPFQLPKDGMLAYYCTNYEVRENITWDTSSYIDTIMLSRGLISENKQDIEAIMAIDDKWGQFRLKAIQIANGWKPDWGNHNQEKHCVFYDNTAREFMIARRYAHEMPMNIYFQTEEQAKRLADWANKYVKM